MLTSLSIRNFALIDQLSIRFPGGFSTITGETGAGKSILLGALSHVLGKRADLSALKDKTEKCIIEAHFNIANYQLQNFFAEYDLDYDDLTIIRREILPSGKSRAFINDSPTGLHEVGELGAYLIDIHSQQQTRALSEEKYQLGILDALADNAALVLNFAASLKELRQERSSLAELRDNLAAAEKEQGYNLFLLEELRAANLREHMQEELESLLEQLSNVGLIKESLGKSVSLGDEEQFGVRKNLREIRAALQKIAGFSAEYSQMAHRIGSLEIEFDDLLREMTALAEKIPDDPAQLEQLSQTLQTIYDLQKKHQVHSVEELIVTRDLLESKTHSVEALLEAINAKEASVQTRSALLQEQATAISKRRAAAIPKLVGELGKLLSGLGMSDARFDIRLQPSADFRENGKDLLEFLFSANKGSHFGSLAKVASGGEMSRIMLAVKAVMAQYSNLPAIIFDEIDTGVSGEISDKMGEIMKKMGENMQVIAITHLPQIAAKGVQQFKVFKTHVGEQTLSELRLLSEEDRVQEIAGMLSGQHITDSAINHARALLK